MFNFLSEKFSHVLGWAKGKSRLTEENIATALQQVEDALLEADVPFDVVTTFLAQVKQDIIGKQIDKKVNPGHHLIKAVHDTLLAFLNDHNPVVTPIPTFAIPSVTMMIGLQGSGKTTTTAKLASWIQKQAQKRGKQRRILLASVDFSRPAAIEQLSILAQKANVSFYQATSQDPRTATHEIYQHFKANRYEMLFFDTAGRLHVNEELMTELSDIRSIINPQYTFLVIDSMVGQESLSVAKTFYEKVGFHSAILTKMDSDTRGGVAFAFRYAVKKPIMFIGSGEKLDDLELFHAERMVTRILGMGDIVSLIEKAEEHIDIKQQEVMAKRLAKGTFTLQDFADQLSSFTKLGSLQKIIQYLPGNYSISPEMIEQGQGQIKEFRAIISSMTPKERIFPRILDASRKKRIAQGSGTSVPKVNALLEKFEQSKQFVKMFNKSGKLKQFWG